MCENGKETQFQWTKVKNQYYAVIIANLVMLGNGCSVGWISPAIPRLLSEDTPLLSGPLTSSQLSWIGSIVCIGSLVGSFIFGYMNTVLGCKRTIQCLSLPPVISWLLIYFGNSFSYIAAARFASGLTAGGIQTTIVLYVSEIANNEIRGTLAAYTQLSRNVGILFAYIIGATVDYHYIPCIFVTIPVIFTILFFRLPNTPKYFLTKNKPAEAEKALKFYKEIDGDNTREKDAIVKEIERIRLSVEDQKSKERITLGDIFNKEALKGILIAITLNSLGIFTSCFAIITYASHIINLTGIEIDSDMAAIVLATMQILGNVCTTQLTDRIGRKVLLVTSLLGAAVGLTTFSIYFYLIDMGFDLRAYQMVPLISLAFVIFIASAGIIAISSVCAVESLTPKTRNIGLVMTVVCMNITAFTTLKLFPELAKMISVHGCMLVFAGSCIIGTVFVVLVVKETKGKDMNQINKN